ncbi:MAG: signal peptidase II [Flavobacteriia bacterium]
MKKNLVIVGAVVALILFLDQFIKVYIKSHFAPGETVSIFGDWFVLEYLENQGMAFGTTFGNKIWHKLALSIFRIVAITGMTYYLIKQAKQGAKRELLIVIGLIVAGATGNLIDSMFYDFAFPYDPCMGFNHLEGSGVVTDCGIFGEIETRHTGFLLGNVVDMFKFQAFWPEWLPWLGGKEVFPAIWNLADASISVGVIMVFIRQRNYFPKEKEAASEE